MAKSLSSGTEFMGLFYSISNERCSEIKISRSRFICHLGHARTPAEAKAFIADVSERHKTATHNCWAYIVGDQAETCHCSDSGEPSGSAGRPMLSALTKRCMTQISAVVTRYYGGTKLGIRGLINAYSQAVTQTLDLEPTVLLVRRQTVEILVEYPFNNTLLHHLGTFRAVVGETLYDEAVTHSVDVEIPDIPAVDAFLRQCRGEGKLQFSWIPC